MNLSAGAKLGRYEILAEIGRGGMGIVYKARDPKIDRLVAIKTISLFGQEAEDGREYRERFVFEARAAGRLSHPGIVTIFDVGEEPENHDPYIVMEYVTGDSLRKLLAADNKKMPLRPALELVQQLAEALHYAHSQGVIHRDIKPSNILVTTGWRAKIADFGIAKLNLAQLTIPGQLLGSPAYMSPEQLSGEGVDARSDLFSLGVILYTMITGYRPFQGNSATTVCFKVVNRDPLPVTSFDADLPPELDEVIVRAMAKDPAERFQTGTEMAEAVSQLLEGPIFLGKAKLSIERATSTASTVKSSANTVSRSRTRTTTSAAALRSKQKSIQNRSLVAASILLLCVGSLAIYRGLASNFFNTAPPPHPPTLIQPAPAHEAVVQSELSQPSTESAPNPTPRHTAPTKTTPSTHAAATTERKASAAVEETSRKPPDEPATMQIEVEHPFTEAEVTVWLDNRAFYTRTVRGQVTKHALVFRQVHGHQSDSVQVPSGQHQIHVRVRTTDDSYDQSKTISGIFAANGETLLLVLCDKRGGELRVTLQ
jgi:eukaryotic-like serine/threonine-protein kinase